MQTCWVFAQTVTYIKMSNSESQGQEEAAWTHVFRPTRPLPWVIYTDGSSKTLKYFNLAAIAAITKLLQAYHALTEYNQQP